MNSSHSPWPSPPPPGQKPVSETLASEAFQNPDVSDLREVEQLPGHIPLASGGAGAGPGKPDDTHGR